MKFIYLLIYLFLGIIILLVAILTRMLYISFLSWNVSGIYHNLVAFFFKFCGQNA